MRKGNSMKTGKNYYSSLFFSWIVILRELHRRRKMVKKVRKQTDYYFPPSFAAGKVDQKR